MQNLQQHCEVNMSRNKSEKKTKRKRIFVLFFHQIHMLIFWIFLGGDFFLKSFIVFPHQEECELLRQTNNNLEDMIRVLRQRSDKEQIEREREEQVCYIHRVVSLHVLFLLLLFTPPPFFPINCNVYTCSVTKC